MEIHRISSDVVEFICEDFPKFDVYIKITDSKDIKTAQKFKCMDCGKLFEKFFSTHNSGKKPSR